MPHSCAVQSACSPEPQEFPSCSVMLLAKQHLRIFSAVTAVSQVLGMAMPKSKKISMSNWECVSLTRSQVKYAALDVLVAGQVFRALRLWHSSPSLCEVCHYNLGAVSTQGVFTCSECEKAHWSIRDYTQHCERAGHKPGWAECEGCGCTRQLPWPSSTAAAAGGQAADAEADHPSSQQSS